MTFTPFVSKYSYIGLILVITPSITLIINFVIFQLPELLSYGMIAMYLIGIVLITIGRFRDVDTQESKGSDK